MKRIWNNLDEWLDIAIYSALFIVFLKVTVSAVAYFIV